MNARGIGYARDRLKLDGADLKADLRMTSNQLALSGVTISALGATITGAAELRDWTNLHFEGNFAGLGVRQAAAIATSRPIPWDGVIDGPFVSTQ